MKGIAAGMLAALMALCGVGAKAQMQLYVSADALDAPKARRILAQLEREQPQAGWTLELEEETGRTLTQCVLADCAPDIAICTPGEALPWAKEELLVPLQLHIADQARMQRQVLSGCVYDETLFIAPLAAHHRQMAVNTRMMKKHNLGYMLDRQAYPVWYPAQFYQILEEFMLADRPALDVWMPDMETAAPLEALTQAFYGGMLLGEDGRCAAAQPEMIGALRWLRDAVDAGMVSLCVTREEALARFLSGETALFIDWTAREQARCAGQLAQQEIIVMPYPSATGLPVRSFELSGACVFASQDAARTAAALEAVQLLHAQAEQLLGARGIWRDGAVWLTGLQDSPMGTTLRRLFAAALAAVLTRQAAVETALADVQAAMEAAR